MTTMLAILCGILALWFLIFSLPALLDMASLFLKVFVSPYHLIKKWLSGGYCEEHEQYFERVADSGLEYSYGMGTQQCYTCHAEARERQRLLSMTHHEEEERRREQEEAVRHAKNKETVLQTIAEGAVDDAIIAVDGHYDLFWASENGTAIKNEFGLSIDEFQKAIDQRLQALKQHHGENYRHVHNHTRREFLKPEEVEGKYRKITLHG